VPASTTIEQERLDGVFTLTTVTRTERAWRAQMASIPCLTPLPRIFSLKNPKEHNSEGEAGSSR
jgi:hypothetical protein